MSFETAVFPEQTHLYAASLNEPAVYTPQAHIFWSERVPWQLFDDDLPKHPEGLQEAARKGRTLLPPA